MTSRRSLAALALLPAIALFTWWGSSKVDIRLLLGAMRQWPLDLATPERQAMVDRLFQAVNAGDLAEIEILLENGADANAVSSHGSIGEISVLELAVSLGDEDVVKLLIEYGADVNSMDGGGNTILSPTTSANADE